MFHEVVDDPGDRDPDELYQQLCKEVVAAIEAAGVERAAERGDVDVGTVERLRDGEDVELSLEQAAGILSAREDAPDAETIAAASRDSLLLGMTTAVLDVEAVESGIEGELEAREIQAKVEGRFPMTLREFARLHQYIEAKTP